MSYLYRKKPTLILNLLCYHIPLQKTYYPRPTFLIKTTVKEKSPATKRLVLRVRSVVWENVFVGNILYPLRKIPLTVLSVMLPLIVLQVASNASITLVHRRIVVRKRKSSVDRINAVLKKNSVAIMNVLNLVILKEQPADEVNNVIAYAKHTKGLNLYQKTAFAFVGTV